MKKIIVILISTLLLTSACEDFLDKSPVNELSPNTYFQDKADLTTWNAAIYNAFQKTLHQAHVNWGEIRSDNVHTTTYADNKYYMNALLATMDDYSWENLYKCISLCTIAIEKYPTIPAIYESDYAVYMGQAYGMRALMYFYGTRVWGKLPIIPESWDGIIENSYYPRSSLEAVKEQIFSDIDMALHYIGTSVSDKCYINRGMIHALKTDAHMWYQEYEDAIESSDYFIDNTNYHLAQGEIEWKDIFIAPKTSYEIIFYMAWDYSENGSNGWAARMGASNTNNGYKMSQSVYNEFVNRLYSGKGRDARLWNTIDTVRIYDKMSRTPLSEIGWYNGAEGINKCIKYSDIDPEREFVPATGLYKSHFKVQSTSDCSVQLSIYRLADIMLLRAEAMNKLGRKEEAIAIINEIRSRVGYLANAADELVSGSIEEIETIILRERQLEFYGEGRRWFDLMRTGRLIETMDAVYRNRQSDSGSAEVTGFGDEGRKYGPVYYREFEANPSLQGDQNKPYSEG